MWGIMVQCHNLRNKSRDMYTFSSYRKRGIAKELFNRIVEEARN